MNQKEIYLQKYHPLVLFLYLLGGIGISISVMHPVFLVFSFFLSGAYGSVWLGRAYWFRLVWMAIPVGLFTLVLMPLFSHQGETPLYYVNDMPVTKETLCYGTVLLLLLLTAFGWLQIASVICMQEMLLYLLSRFLPKFGLLLAMALRLIPLMGQRFREIKEAQQGLFGEENPSVMVQLKLTAKALSILVSWFLEESIERAVSMESRGYGVRKRTSFVLFRWEAKDSIAAVLLLIFYGITAWCFLCREYTVHFFPQLQMEKLTAVGKMGLLSFAAAVLLPAVFCLIHKLQIRLFPAYQRIE